MKLAKNIKKNFFWKNFFFHVLFYQMPTLLKFLQISYVLQYS